MYHNICPECGKKWYCNGSSPPCSGKHNCKCDNCHREICSNPMCDEVKEKAWRIA